MTYWYVGANWDGEDQTSRFVENGNWVNGYEDRYLDVVQNVQINDQIAIKSTFRQRRGFDFDTRGSAVSMMKIKAIGTVTENPGDGRTLIVDWTPINPPRDWCFTSFRKTIHSVNPDDDWKKEALINFTFNNEEQNINQFRNDPQFSARFGDGNVIDHQFEWIPFYMAMANQLLTFANNREELIEGIHDISSRVEGMKFLQDKYPNGTSEPLNDICPFTAISTFNRGTTLENRINIATELANFLGVIEPVPDSFEGVPLIMNLNSWFFAVAENRQPDDIDKLWTIFSEAIRFADSGNKGDLRQSFKIAYDAARNVKRVKWNLTMGLFWIRPREFITLDQQTRNYIAKHIKFEDVPSSPPTAEKYLELHDRLLDEFKKDDCPVHSFPELSHKANVSHHSGSSTEGQGEKEPSLKPVNQYTIDNIMDDGCFLSREKLIVVCEHLRRKKNLILQGSPGTGKTWLAKRLAYELIGTKNSDITNQRLRVIQFHPTLSYEDFVRGWRPDGEKGLKLIDGVFMEAINAARDDERPYAIIIEEINRGNPAQIFGEMLTLLENDKRREDEAIELAYRHNDNDRVFIPDNLYIIGTMNIADRSLALVDLALRRRFAFITLETMLNERWKDWCKKEAGLEENAISTIQHRINELNETIENDLTLGKQFRIGHSYVTPVARQEIDNPYDWFKKVVEAEISPLLEEYWFDNPSKLKESTEKLIEDF